jgi:branched-chain amino acid aminotransferase
MTANKIGSRAWLDGQTVGADQAYISLTDRGFTLGDGLFETLLWTGHDIRFFDDHMARLSASAAELGIPLPLPAADIHLALLDLGRDAAGKIAALRLTLTRGNGPRGLALPADPRPRLMATIAELNVQTIPVRLMTVAIRRNCTAPSSRLKTMSYIDNIMALKEAQATGGDDAIMLATTGHVACSTSANLVIRFQGKNLTPAVADGALPGIIRGRLLGAGLIEEATINAGMLASCTYAALTNALIGARAVSAIDNRSLTIDSAWLQTLREVLLS